jgi:WD40 repeat protein/tetratricopeptide (TPR) repeat protein/tRNA A-37 threonylcarbamoyl transferase component Bud32
VDESRDLAVGPGETPAEPPLDLRTVVTRAGGPGGPQVLEALQADQARRWRQGQRVLVEAYLDSAPGLRDDQEGVLDLIVGELLLRQERGEQPSLSEYMTRFPGLAGPLTEQFEMERMLVAEATAGGVTSGTPAHAGSSDASASTPGGTDAVTDGAIVSVRDEGQIGDDDQDALPRGTSVRYFGDYELRRVLGRGGMGVVYKARQKSLNRLVALKMIRADHLVGDEERRRFRNEAEAVAQLDHPHIVPIYEVGEHDGHPYFAMKMVAGPSLAARLDSYRNDPAAAARLMVVVADAVHHAHQRAILHRDLKPANILLDEAGQPHVVDFGLAKRLAEEGNSTLSGALLGTPAFMAPEQAASRRGAVTTATDVYGLGAILYTLLTGQAPFQGMGLVETLEQVRTRAPAPPSRSNRRVARDLEVVCLKCLEKEPGRRYGSADALAVDLRRWLAGRPVAAKPAGLARRGWMWCHRNRAVAGLLACLMVALVGGFAVIARLWLVAEDRAKVAVQKGEQAVELAKSEARARAEAQHLALDRGIGLADQGHVGKGLIWLAEAIRQAPADDADLLRAARANFSAWRDRLIVPRWIVNHPLELHDVALSSDGRIAAVSCKDGTISLRDTETGRLIRPPLEHPSPLRLAFLPHGRVLISLARDGSLRIFEVGSGLLVGSVSGVGRPGYLAPLLVVSSDGRSFFVGTGPTGLIYDAGTYRPIGEPVRLGDQAITAAAYSPAGDRLVVADGAGHIAFWDAGLGRKSREMEPVGSGVRALAFSPDGTRLAVGTGILNEGRAFVFDASDLHRVAATPSCRAGIMALAFRGDGKSFAVGDADGKIWLWDASADKAVGTAIDHRSPIARAEFSPDGRMILVTSGSGAARLWDGADGWPLGPVLDHGAKINAAAFLPDGRMFVTAGADGTLRCWDASACLTPGRTLPLGDLVQAVDVTPDGILVATASFDGTARVFDAATGRPVGPPLPHHSRIRAVRISPDGKFLATGSDDHNVRLWEVSTGRPLGSPLGQVFWTWDLAFSPSGKSLFVACVGPTGRLWDLDRRAPIGPILRFPNDEEGHEVRWAFLGRKGRVAIACTTGGSVWFWDASTGRPLTSERVVYEGRIRAASLAPDDRTLLLVTDGQIRTWDMERLAEVGQPFGQNVISIACGPGGRELVSGGADWVARRWNLTTRQPSGPPMDHPGQVWSVAYSPDGRTLLTATREGQLRFWDVATGKPIGPSLGHGADLSRGHERGGGSGVLFAPGGGYAISFGEFARIWPVPGIAEGEPRDLMADASALAGITMDGEKGLTHLDPGRWARLLEQRSLEMVPGASDLKEAEWHDRNALDCERRGMLGAALWHLDRLVEARPEEWWPRARRAFAREGLGDYAGALSDEKQAIRLGPSERLRDWRAHLAFKRSNAAAGRGHWDEALAPLDLLVATYPDDVSSPFRLRRAEARSRLGRWDEALSDLEAIVAAAPDGLAPGLVLQIHRLHALLALKVGRYDRYRSTCEALLSWAPRARSADGGPAWEFANSVAWVCVLGPGEVADPQALVRLAEGALKMSNDRSKDAVMNTLGAAHFRAGDPEKTIRLIEESIALRGGAGSPADWAFLAMAHADLGEREKARSWSAKLAGWAPSAGAGAFWDDLEVALLRDQVKEKVNPADEVVR